MGFPQERLLTESVRDRGWPIMLMVGAIALVAGCRVAVDLHEQPQSYDVIFASNRTGHFKLWQEDLRTHELTQLTTGPGDDNNPQPGPNGQIVFYSDRINGVNQLFRLNRERPRQVEQLSFNPAHTYDPTVLPTGAIAYKYQDDIWIMNSDGSGKRNLTPGEPGIEKYKPAPIDAAHLSYTGRLRHTGNVVNDANSDELYTLDVLSGTRTRLTHNAVADWFSDYSAGSGLLAFVSRQRADGPDRIFTARPDMSARTLFPGLAGLQGDCSDVAWAPDGKSIVFVNNDAGSYDVIYQAGLDGKLTVLDKQEKTTSLAPILVPHIP